MRDDKHTDAGYAAGYRDGNTDAHLTHRAVLWTAVTVTLVAVLALFWFLQAALP